MSLLQVSAVSRQEGGAYLLKEISFTQKEFQKIAIAGATGSGKTTLLKIISGLEQPDGGEVLFEGVRVLGPFEKLIPGHPRIAYLSQHFELRNHYRVEEILQMANLIGEQEAHNIYEICRIDHLLSRWTHQLSGGERQRISLARLLVAAPKLLVLDEPYSNLDAIHTNILKTVINDISEKLKITCLLVSHDPHDMLPWADEIIILQNGQIIQKGTPIEVYKSPVNEHAAALFGKYNVVTPHLIQAFPDHPGINRFIRPEDFTIEQGQHQGIKGVVKKAYFMGNYYEYVVHISRDTIIVHANEAYQVGDTISVSLKILAGTG